MPHAKDSGSGSIEGANREMSQVEFPDEVDDGILIWPSDRDFWTDEPLQFKLILADRVASLAVNCADVRAKRAMRDCTLRFEISDLRGSLVERLKGCELLCRYEFCEADEPGEDLHQEATYTWHFEISFAQTIGDSHFVRDAMDALEKLQMEQPRLTSFAEAFGLIPSSEKSKSADIGAHLFFP